MSQQEPSPQSGAEIFPVKARDLVHVVWGEERAAMPALVIDVDASGFTAFVSIQEGPQGPFSFFFSDLASRTSKEICSYCGALNNGTCAYPSDSKPGCFQSRESSSDGSAKR